MPDSGRVPVKGGQHGSRIGRTDSAGVGGDPPDVARRGQVQCGHEPWRQAYWNPGERGSDTD